jgi:type I restriction enzyme S subunit
MSSVEETATLATLRDTLLPRLISGEIQVRDAERILEDAT